MTVLIMILNYLMLENECVNGRTPPRALILLPIYYISDDVRISYKLIAISKHKNYLVCVLTHVMK